MKLFHREIKKVIVENTMGDGKKQIKVKFVYMFYIMSKLIFSFERFDPINFYTVKSAEKYAEYALSPSSYLTNKDRYARGEKADLFKVHTVYNKHLSRQNHVIRKFGLTPNNYYILFKNASCLAYTTCHIDVDGNREDISDFIIASVHRSYNENIFIDDYSYNVIDDGKLPAKYKDFSEMVNRKIQHILDEKKKSRLSVTVIESIERVVKPSDNTAVLNNTPAGLSKLDIERNKLIQNTIKENIAYNNMLRTLLK